MSLYIRPNIPVNTVNSILNTPYFSSWLVGFIEAESTFSIYKPKKSLSQVASFEITQTNDKIIILAIKEYLNFTQNVTVDKTNNFKIKVSSIKSIDNIIKFLNKAPVKLLGYKKSQYITWIEKLKSISRYSKKIKIIDIY